MAQEDLSARINVSQSAGAMFLGEEEVRELLRMEELIPAMAGALRDLSAGKVEQPMRLVLPVAEHNGFFAVMPAYGGALGAKLVTFLSEQHGSAHASCDDSPLSPGNR